MFCTNCGKQLNDGAAFCSACGTRLSSPQEDVVVVSVPEEIVPPVQAEETAVFVEEKTAPVVEEVAPVVEEVAPVVEEVAPVVEEAAPVEQEKISVAVEPISVAENVISVAEEIIPVAQEVAPVESDVQQDVSPLLAQYQSKTAIVSQDLKKSLGSAVAIIATVVYLIMLVARVAATAMCLGNFNVSETLGTFSIDLFDYEALINGAFMAVLFIGLVPALMILVGLVYNIIQSYRKKGFSSGGFVIIKTAAIVKLIFNALTFLIFAGAAAFILIWLDGIVDSAMEKLNSVNAVVNIDPLTNTLKWIGLAVCLFVAVWKAVEIAYNAVVMFSAKRMDAAIADGCAKQRRFIGLRTMNYILVCINGIILSVQLVFIILGEKVTDYIVQLLEDTNMFSSSDIGTISDAAGQFGQFFAWGAIATVLFIAVLLMFNANISNHVQSKELVEAQK